MKKFLLVLPAFIALTFGCFAQSATKSNVHNKESQTAVANSSPGIFEKSLKELHTVYKAVVYKLGQGAEVLSNTAQKTGIVTLGSRFKIYQEAFLVPQLMNNCKTTLSDDRAKQLKEFGQK